jgi:hypothetical protein
MTELQKVAKSVAKLVVPMAFQSAKNWAAPKVDLLADMMEILMAVLMVVKLGHSTAD